MAVNYVGTIDQGTTSTRFILFSKSGEIDFVSQLEHKQIFPQPGEVEHDPFEILENCRKTMREVLCKSNIPSGETISIGITNQRETIVVWNKKTGRPYYNAIVWQDTRSRPIIEELLGDGHRKKIHQLTGLIPSPYFSASKLKWILDNVEHVREDAEKGEVAAGTIDTWLLWNLCENEKNRPHITDVTNASRFLLMNIRTMEWDDELLELFDIPKSILPEIRPSIPAVPYASGLMDCGTTFYRLLFSGILGDQQAALFGQACFQEGQSKCTYGTGGFLLMNTGHRPIFSTNGLLTTIAYQKEGERPVYALEGAVAVAGSLVQWVRDNLQLIDSAPEIDKFAMEVEDSGGVYFVPAFAGLFAPYWRPRARGVICGLTGYARKAHICRAVLESTAFQVNDLFDAIRQDCDIKLPALRVDGGMTVSEPLMQTQADFLGVSVIRPAVRETTALGAAYAAGISAGFWNGEEDLIEHWKEDCRWQPQMKEEKRLTKLAEWKKAIERSFGWR